MKKKIIKKDPLKKNVFIGGETYETAVYPQSMYIPNVDSPLYQIKSFQKTDLLISFEILSSWAADTIDNDEFNTEAEILADWLKEKPSHINWEELVLEICFKKQKDSNRISKKALKEKLLKTSYDWDSIQLNELEYLTQQFLGVFFEQLLQPGKLTLRDKVTGNFVSEISYYGEGSQVGPTCGSGGVRWTYQEEEIYYLMTWIS
jgi:hypothetical protein